MEKYEIIAWVAAGIFGNSAIIGVIIKILTMALEIKIEKIAQKEIGLLANNIKLSEARTDNKFDSIFNKIEEIKNQFMAHVIEDVKSFLELKNDMERIIKDIEDFKNSRRESL